MVTKPSSNTSPFDYRPIAESKLGKNVSYALNENQTMVLCKNLEDTSTPAMVNTVRFLVISLKNNIVLYEDQLANADVEWHKNTQLKIHTFPGTVQIIPDKQKHYYLYDLETKRKLLPAFDKF